MIEKRFQLVATPLLYMAAALVVSREATSTAGFGIALLTNFTLARSVHLPMAGSYLPVESANVIDVFARELRQPRKQRRVRRRSNLH